MIDYKELLMKYIDHIGRLEGVTFLSLQPRYFSDEEWEELQKLDKESEGIL